MSAPPLRAAAALLSDGCWSVYRRVLAAVFAAVWTQMWWAAYGTGFREGYRRGRRVARPVLVSSRPSGHVAQHAADGRRREA